jgi:hypothetical protein
MDTSDQAESSGAGRAGNTGKPRRLRPRFSLATLILAATIVCLLVALWATSRRLQETRLELALAQDELQKYRNELGYLTISDSNKVHAIGVRTPGRLRWRWRVYLPENRRFRLHTVTGGVPKDGIAAPGKRTGMSSTIQSGECLLHAYVERGHNGKWLLFVDKPSGSGSVSIPENEGRWVEEGLGWSIQQIKPGSMQVFEPGRPAVLLRLRVHTIVEKHEDGRTSQRAPEEPCDGLMIWIEEEPASQPGPQAMGSRSQRRIRSSSRIFSATNSGASVTRPTTRARPT